MRLPVFFGQGRCAVTIGSAVRLSDFAPNATAIESATLAVRQLVECRAEAAKYLGVQPHELVNEARRLASLLMRCADCDRLTDRAKDPADPNRTTVCPECLERRR